MKAPKRPRDTNQLAKAIVDIAAGEVTEAELSAHRKNSSEGGLIGGAARSRVLTASERKAIAEKGANARWRKDRLALETKE